MTSDSLVSHSATDPIWGFVAQLRAAEFSGEAIVGVGPRVRLFARRGAIYLAEREGDPSLPSRLVTSGALSPEQLAKGVTLVDGVMSLSKLFVREPGADRTAVELAIANENEAVLLAVANDPVVTVELHADHHHSSGVHEWLTEPDEFDLTDASDGTHASDDTRASDDPRPTSTANAAPDAVPELLHMPDSTHLVEPLTITLPRAIEPIRIEPIRIEPIRSELVHPAVGSEVQPVGAPTPDAAFAPPPHFAESALVAPPPLPSLVGMEEMSDFEQQFHVDLTATEPEAAPPEPDAAPVDESFGESVGESVATLLTLPALPTLPTLGTITSWQPAEPAAQPFTPEAGLSSLDLPKLAATSKSVAEIVADQTHRAEEAEQAERAEQAQQAEQAEQAQRAAHASATLLAGHTDDDPTSLADSGFAPLTHSQPADPFSSLPRFADLVAGDSTIAAAQLGIHAHEALDDNAPAAIAHPAGATAPCEPVFETETLWTPPPADITASEIWHLVDEMGRPVTTPADGRGDAEAARSHRFHFGRHHGRRATKD